jgi:hypothetical protein
MELTKQGHPAKVPPKVTPRVDSWCHVDVGTQHRARLKTAGVVHGRIAERPDGVGGASAGIAGSVAEGAHRTHPFTRVPDLRAREPGPAGGTGPAGSPVRKASDSVREM